MRNTKPKTVWMRNGTLGMSFTVPPGATELGLECSVEDVSSASTGTMFLRVYETGDEEILYGGTSLSELNAVAPGRSFIYQPARPDEAQNDMDRELLQYLEQRFITPLKAIRQIASTGGTMEDVKKVLANIQ